MEKYQEKAWSCLTKVEQDSLFLTLSQGLSTWQTGEILKISHYKYLEIKARAEKFFKMFSDYFQLHEDLVNPESPLDGEFRDYLYGSMLKRLPKPEALEYAGDSSWLLHPVSTKRILKNMERLKGSKDPWDKDLYALIMEFDRWNNYRILPRSLQAPTAYKRRSNKKDKIYIRYLHRIPDFKIRAIVDKYWRNGQPGKRYFICLISTLFAPGYLVVPILKREEIVEELTKLKIYIFSVPEEAELFGILVNQFLMINTPPEGLKFWKNYRELISEAINYRSVKNMDFTTQELDMAYQLKRKKNIY